MAIENNFYIHFVTTLKFLKIFIQTFKKIVEIIDFVE